MRKLLTIIGLTVVIMFMAAGCSKGDPGQVYTMRFNELVDQDYNVSKQVQELDGKIVSMTGFMAMQSPLDGSFVYLTNAPMVSCPYCVPGTSTPIYTITAVASVGKPIIFTEQPVTVTGVLEVENKTDQFGYTTPFRIHVESLNVADAKAMPQSLKEYTMIASDGVTADVYLILDQLIAYTCYDLTQLDPNMIYSIDIEEVDRLIAKVKSYGLSSYDPLVTVLEKAKVLAVEVNNLIELDEKESLITYAEEGLSIWNAYFAWADEIASLD
jgi:hypothetical protein